MNGAQWLVQALITQGVEQIFGYPGGPLCLFMTLCMIVI